MSDSHQNECKSPEYCEHWEAGEGAGEVEKEGGRRVEGAGKVEKEGGRTYKIYYNAGHNKSHTKDGEKKWTTKARCLLQISDVPYLSTR